MESDHIVTILRSLDVYISNNILYDIQLNISHNNPHQKNHISFLIDIQTRKILSYGFNHFFQSNTFPWSVHSEVHTILKYYKKRVNTKNKKILVALRLTKKGVISMSKPCVACANFIKHNYDNLHLSCIYYSYRDPYNNYPRLRKLDKRTLMIEPFKQSSGYNHHKTPR